MIASMEEKRGDSLDLVAIKTLGPLETTLHDVNNAHHHCGHSGPLHAPSDSEDVSVVRADPAHATRSRIPLAYGVGGDEAERTAIPQKIEGAPEEMGYEVG